MADAIKCDNCGQFQADRESGYVVNSDNGFKIVLCATCFADLTTKYTGLTVAAPEVQAEPAPQSIDTTISTDTTTPTV